MLPGGVHPIGYVEMLRTGLLGEALMRQVSMATRDELLAALTVRFAQAGRGDKARMLTEFVALTGYHRKHAARLLRGGGSGDRSAPRSRRRLYDDAVREALILLWEASDRICGKRLKPLIPMLVAAMERHGHLALNPAVRERLEAISAATINRILKPVHQDVGSRGRRRRAPSSEVRRAMPIRTYADWSDPPPGFFEADLVSHSVRCESPPLAPISMRPRTSAPSRTVSASRKDGWKKVAGCVAVSQRSASPESPPRPWMRPRKPSQS